MNIHETVYECRRAILNDGRNWSVTACGRSAILFESVREAYWLFCLSNGVCKRESSERLSIDPLSFGEIKSRRMRLLIFLQVW